MKRIRISTVLLLIVIVGLTIALVIEHRRADRFEPAYLREIRPGTKD